MTSIHATAASRQLQRLMGDVADSHQPIEIVGKQHAAVLVSAEDWRAVQETLYLTGVPGMRASIRRGLQTPVAKRAKVLRACLRIGLPLALARSTQLKL